MSDKIDTSLVKKAVGALLNFDKERRAKSDDLIEDYAKPMQAQIQLVQDVKEPVLKPVRVKIPNTIFNPTGQEEHNICLFCRSEDKEGIVSFLASGKNGADGKVIDGLFCSKENTESVLSINDVKKLYKEFKDLKKLSVKFTHFVCDARITSQLYNLLGKSFGSRNNYPIPMDFKQISKLPLSVQKVVQESTYLHLRGRNIQIRFGNANMTSKKLVENIAFGLNFAIEGKIPGGWPSVHSIGIKLADSAALPVYAKDPNDSGVSFLKGDKKETKKDENAKGKAKASAGGDKKDTKAKTPLKEKEQTKKPSTPATGKRGRGEKEEEKSNSSSKGKAATPSVSASAKKRKTEDAATPKAATTPKADAKTPKSAVKTDAKSTATPKSAIKSPVTVAKSGKSPAKGVTLSAGKKRTPGKLMGQKK